MPDKITKFIESLDQKTRQRLKEKIAALRQDPFQMRNVKKLIHYGQKAYRFRLGDIRIIYIVKGDKSIEIMDIDWRGNIY